MKRVIHCVLGLLLAVSSVRAAALREKININREWRFTLGNPAGAEAAGFDDPGWEAIHLPHSFSMPYFQWKDFYVGYGWYRKHLKVAPEWTSKRVSLEFEGAFQDAEIFVNGTLLKEHKGGYTGFAVDITPAIHAGDNVLAVKLNNNWSARIEPRSGDHTFMGGIYRNVYLVVTDPLHVTWYGTFLTTPVVSKDAAAVNVKTEVANDSSDAKNCVVTTEIRDPSGKAVAQFAATQKINAGATVTFDQTSPTIGSPQLWGPSHPFLYTAVTHVAAGTRPADDYTTSFGIRSIQWTADKGFFINGEHLYFHGANVHQDHAGWGDAVTNSGARRDVELVKDAGMDFIRGSHYPHHPAFADACDELGVLFWSENCFWGCGRGKKEGTWMTADAYPPNVGNQGPFEENALETLRDEIRIFRNHPSVVAWSMCNEVFFSGNQPKVKDLLRKLVKECHALDPTRPAAIGGCQRGGLDKIGDVAGYNGDGARLPEYQNPGIANVVSEYGSHISDRGDPKTDLYNGMFKTNELNASTPEYLWRSGQSLWCAFDYSTILGHFGSMGFVDYFRIPKRSWYWYRNAYRHIPPPEWPKAGRAAKLSLSADKTTIAGADGTDDCQIRVTVEDGAGKWISNSPPVTLTIESGPGEFPTGRSITFRPPSADPASDIGIRDGLAAMEFRSYFGGKSVIRASSPGLVDGVLTITTVGDPVFVPGKSPLAPDRPYLRFVAKKTEETGRQNLAWNHPVSASSEAPAHGARRANDGDTGAGWQASDDQAGAWWQVDMEGLNSIASVETRFSKAANYRYRIEGSPDGSAWTSLADQTRTTETSEVRTDSCARNENIRFLRLILTGLPAKEAAVIEEIRIFGKPS